MDAGELYALSRDLKLFAERALDAQRDAAEAFSATQQRVLGQVLAQPGITISELASTLQLAQSGVSTAVATLRERELLQTTPGEDRRRSHVHPTARLAGWAKERLDRDVNDVARDLLAHLGAADRACVLRALPLLAGALQQERETWSAAAGQGTRRQA